VPLLDVADPTALMTLLPAAAVLGDVTLTATMFEAPAVRISWLTDVFATNPEGADAVTETVLAVHVDESMFRTVS